MRRLKLKFTSSIDVEFSDRELALERVREWGERGTVLPQVVFGPEGCGKSAWLIQSTDVLVDMGYDVVYINPIEEITRVELGVRSLRDVLVGAVREALLTGMWGKVLNITIDVVREAIRAGRGKIAILVDEAFQVIGLERSASYVKALLGLIEHPPVSYDRIVVVVTTSEGLSRGEIGRHLWAQLRPMWNMSREGFRELYEQIPGDKPSFDDVWKWTGGNPRILRMLYEVGWNPGKIVEELLTYKRLDTLIAGLSVEEKRLLWESLEDPDSLITMEGLPLLSKLVERNLVLDGIPERDTWMWVDTPPPEMDKELGIGRKVAWQTPVYKEAVRRALEKHRI